MIDINDLRFSAANSVRDLALLPSEVLELLDRIEAAEKERDWHAERCEDAMNECDALRTAVRHESDCVEAAKTKLKALRAKTVLCVPNGWKEAAIAWEVCASIHREYGKGKDPFFNTRQGDFVKHANDARAMLAAAPKQEAQPAPSEQDESGRKLWARFSNELHRSPDAPYPGMSEAFELHFSQPFTDRDWHAESGTWASAWKAAKRHGAKTVLCVPDAVMTTLDNLDDYIARIEGNDRGACDHINLLRRYLLDATEVGENE